MNYLSVCSGIEAATVAWHPLGWTPFGFSQFDPDHDYSRGPDFPSAVLAHHYGSNLPGTAWSGNAPPNFGDMTKFEEWPDAAIDLLVGGTPCQDYSVAGLRAGMDGVRGSLTLTYAAIARKYRAAWLVWENVPGVLSSNAGRDFASFLGLLAGRRIEVPAGGWQSAGIVPGYERAYGLAWRVLDAQFVRVDGFGRAVPQRRRRVFVVGYLGDWRRAAAVLFERESLCGNPAPRREPGQTVAPTISARSKGGGGLGTDFDCDVGLIVAGGVFRRNRFVSTPAAWAGSTRRRKH
ncbi:MAG: DNA cytosine methyltransferase [Afipia sp.]|nr:DNA cytosine methyltransferase [Afipia sp.]